MSPELTHLLQTLIWNCGQHIQPFFKGGKADGNWRNLDIFYKSGDDCIATAAGQVTFSPSWFEQAHDVSKMSLKQRLTDQSPVKGPCHHLKPSVSLRPETFGGAGREWLSDMTESSTLLSSIVRVIHPELYAMGIETMKKMGMMVDPPAVLRLWYSIFNGVQVISNRETPVHRDHNSRWEWYDLLATLGPYQGAILELPGVGLRFSYESGTVLGICGRLLRHGVSEAVGERFCLAYFMRENVQKRMETPYAGLNNWDSYKN